MNPMLLLRAAAVAVLSMPAWGHASQGSAPVVQAGARLVTLRLEGVPARDAAPQLARASGLAISPLWKDSEHPEGVDPDRLVTIDCRAATPLRALEMLVRALGPELTWQGDGAGALEIGPRSRLNDRQTVRIYDIHDLLSHAPDFASPATIDLEAALSGGKGSVIKESPEKARLTDDAERQDRCDRLIDLLTSTIEPEQWDTGGGSAAHIRAYQSTLVVKAPPYIHRQISGTIEAERPLSSPGK